MGSLAKLVIALAVSAVGVYAGPSCLLPQQGAVLTPATSRTIVSSLHNVVSASKNGICSGGWPTLPGGKQGQFLRRSTRSMVLTATRHDQLPHRGKACTDAFSSIIDSCLALGKSSGGNTTADGVDYSIYTEKSAIPEPSAIRPTSLKVSQTSSTSASATPTGTQLIKPKSRTAVANNDLTTELQGLFGDRLLVVAAAPLGVLYWAAPLDPDQIRHYKQHPVVRKTHAVCCFSVPLTILGVLDHSRFRSRTG